MSNISKEILIKKCSKEDLQNLLEPGLQVIKISKQIDDTFLWYKLTQTPENITDLLDLGEKLYSFIQGLNLSKVIFDIDLPDQKIISIILGFYRASWNYDAYKKKANSLEKVLFTVINMENFDFSHSNKILDSINFAKELVYTPSNEKYPEKLCSKICEKLKDKNLKLKILEEDDLKKLGMNMLLGVSQGSQYKPKVLIIQKGENPDIAFVGKGVTFDTGGISLKPSKGMEEMISDMTGTAVMAGLSNLMADSNSDFYCICVMVENMVGEKAQRPGDIVRSMSGKTAQVLNTDAEGRLILGDVVTYVQDVLKINKICTIATLTGAARVCLGEKHACLMTNNDNYAAMMIEAGLASGETVWRLPMGPEYDDLVACDVADVQNISDGKGAGTIAGGKFIEAFIDREKTSLIHIDIGNVARIGKKYIPYGILLLSRFLSTFSGLK